LRQEKQFLLEAAGLTPKETETPKNSSKNYGKAYIVPTLQMNVINYREDENTFLELVRQLLQDNSQQCRLRLGTGYLNL
jgi:hypothetical protein